MNVTFSCFRNVQLKLNTFLRHILLYFYRGIISSDKYYRLIENDKHN